MAQEVATRPRLVAPRAPTLDAVRTFTGGAFDVDAYHVMERRDEALIEEELLHGHLSSAFLYNFQIQGTTVIGVSVVGARHLASQYGGIHHRMVSSVRKKGPLFVFQTYPSLGIPMQVTSAILPELEEEDDFFGCLVEVHDIKRGNTLQVEVTENRQEWSAKQNRYFDRPAYMKIAQAKAFRNGVLGILPQDTLIQWREEVLKLGKNVVITGSVLDEKRGNVIRYAAQQGLLIDRRAIDELTLDQISGLGDAARAEQAGAFLNAARGLGLEVGAGEPQAEAPQATPAQQTPAETQHSRRAAAEKPTRQTAPDPARPDPSTPPSGGEEQVRQPADRDPAETASPAAQPGRQEDAAGDGSKKPAAAAKEPAPSDQPKPLNLFT